ncbi:MAG TPA: ATP-binding protein [Myxococcaceae bacterium]|nr:ATP-binding protein [Myxococcaceae bacterium]
MKSDIHAIRLTPSLTQDAFQAFFEALEHPAALCDAHLHLLTTNSAFDGLCGARVSPGQDLATVLKEIAGEVPPDGDHRDVEVTLSSGQQVTLTLSRRGDTVAVVARNLAQAAAVGSLAAAGRAIVKHAEVEQTLLELGREVAGSASEEELVAVVARGVKALFPGRSFCVRIADQRTLQLTSLYAEGRLADGASDVMVFKRVAAEKTNLHVSTLPPERVKVIDDEVPLMFQGTSRSLCAPLVASGQLFGVINIEYPEGMQADLVDDNHLLIQLANQVAVGIRNAKLIDELTFVRKYLEELLEHANALILVASRERRIVVFNKNISQLTGLRRDEVLGQDLINFIPENERMRVQRVVAASLRGEQVSNFETRLVGAGGREVRVSFATSAVLTARGDVEGVIAIGQDLTVVKELEKRIIQAEKLASLGQLAASVVHEINNPMTAVATYADALLQRNVLNPKADPADQDKLRKIIDNSNRILRFTRDLVSYARPADDKPEKVDLHKLLDMAVSFCDHVLHQHKVAVEREYGEIPQVLAVRGNLVQVFVNLITNACHAMQPGGVVKLSTRVEGNDVRMEVADTGTGIKADHLEKIFEPFFTTKPDGKGTGLGLSIVQGIVEKHGGVIKVYSALGVGTRFSIRLPLPE